MFFKLLHIICVLALTSLSLMLFVTQLLLGRFSPLGTVMGVGIFAMSVCMMWRTTGDTEDWRL